MLGKKKFEPKLMYNLTIDDLVPTENFYRRLDELLDMRFVYHKCKDLYGNTGNPSIDPVVFFKLSLVSFFENIISDRELIRKANDMLSVRYFLGYDIDEKLPWHSTVSRTRGIIRQELFEDIFNIILKMCYEAGLIEGKHQSVDSTLVKANASLDSLEVRKPDLEVKEFTKKVYEENNLNDSQQKADNSRDKGDTNDNAKTEPELKFIEKQNRDGKKVSTNINKKYVSKTDPDSKVASKPGTITDMYYATFYSVDSKKKVITDVYTQYADKNDRESLIPVVDRASKRLASFGLTIEELSTDKGFCSGKNLRAIENRNIIPYLAVQKFGNRNGGYTSDKFIYDEDKNVCICPNNKELKYYGYNEKEEKMDFSAKKTDCAECPLKAACCPTSEKRRLRRTVYAKEYERLYARLKTPEAKRAARLRKTGPEPLYAEAKMYHGSSKYMSKGIDKAQKRAYIIAAGQNLKRLLSDWGRLKNKISQFKFSFSFIKYFIAEPSFKIS